jgi:hypothetical protein
VGDGIVQKGLCVVCSTTVEAGTTECKREEGGGTADHDDMESGIARELYVVHVCEVCLTHFAA